jgi:hypothetical protein
MDGSAARSNDNGAALCPAFERRGAPGSTTFLGMTLPPPPPQFPGGTMDRRAAAGHGQ